MNFLIIYFKDGSKQYLNISDIDGFTVGSDSIRITFFSSVASLTYTTDKYDKWELI